MFLNSIDCKSLLKIKWNLKRISNFIQIINDYGVENKHDLTEQIHFVARERRRGDRPPTKNVIWGIYIWSM
jgi:hypothetical protein